MVTPPILNLDQPVTLLPTVGKTYAQKLAKLDIHTLRDLLHHYPFRYQDVSALKTINQLETGDNVTLFGTIIDIKSIHLRSGKTLQKAIFSDGSGTLEINWFNQPYLIKTLSHTPQIAVSGKIKRFGPKLILTSPQYELSPHPPHPKTNLHTGRLVPIYPETAGVTSKWLRTKISKLLSLLPPSYDYLPPSILQRYHLPTLTFALQQIHFPDNDHHYTLAKKRLSFDELLTYQLLSQIRKNRRHTLNNYFPITTSSAQIADFISSLPFSLTPGQSQALNDITRDFNGTSPMNRLVQGDVGSGKTAVAAIAAFMAIKSGYKVVFMVPTETLANQHFATLSSWFDPQNIRLGLATKSNRQDLTNSDLVIGTHALLHRPLPQPIGLVIIDEQHRFGVKQRAQLINTHQPPHVLSLTATPIPRTIALTLYSEIDISTIKDMPAGRLPVKTYVVPRTKRQAAYDWIAKQIANGDQVYVVCPLIFNQQDPTENEVKSAQTEYQRLTSEIFPHLRIGLIHGKLTPKEKSAVIAQFSQGNIDILVATPVIEVGIDIKNATIMVIEGAERFGLASLHQLRGRVGRGDKQSYCLLFPTHDNTNALSRLRQLERHHNGLELAEIDLHLRGQGDLYGTKQSGHIELKIASLNDLEMIETTHQAAKDILTQDPNLESIPQLHPLIKDNGLCYNT